MELLEVFTTQGWDIRYSPQHLIVETPSRSAARDCVRFKAKTLAAWAKKFGCDDTLIFFPGCPKPYQVPAWIATKEETLIMSQLIIPTPGLQIAEMRLSLPILQVFSEFLEFPERKSGLIRLSDDRQIALSESSAALIRSASLEEAVRRKRSDYWYLPDLESVNQITRQQLTPDDRNSVLEFSWRSPSIGGSTWRRYTNQYRLVSDSYGIIYQVSTSLGFEEIPAPVGV